MKDIVRVTPENVKTRIARGATVLVCAYDDQAKFERNHLEGAISLDTLRSKVSSLSKDQELVFYCA